MGQDYRRPHDHLVEPLFGALEVPSRRDVSLPAAEGRRGTSLRGWVALGLVLGLVLGLGLLLFARH